MASQAGLYVVGEYLSAGAGNEYTSRGTVHKPWEVKVLAGETVYKLVYRDEAGARAALGAIELRKQVSLRIGVRLVAGKNGTTPWLSWIGFSADRAA